MAVVARPQKQDRAAGGITSLPPGLALADSLSVRHKLKSAGPPEFFRAVQIPVERRYKLGMSNRTQPKTLGQWIRYIVVAVIALWLVVWMLRISGINLL